MDKNITSVVSRNLAAIVAAPILLLALVYIRSTLRWRNRTKGVPLPPGPKPLPLVGNLFDIPQTGPASLTYQDLSAKYGDVMYLRILGQDIIILGSVEATIDLFDKRSSNFSNRPSSGLELLVGFQYLFAHMAYGKEWREHRRMLWQQVNPAMVPPYQPGQRADAHQLLRRLLDDSSQVRAEIHMMLGGSFLRLVYGIEVKDLHDENLHLVRRAIEALSRGLQPATWLAEYLPFIDRIPQWLPGTSTQRQFAAWRQASAGLREIPFARAQEIIAKPRADETSPILVRTLLDANLTAEAGSEEALQQTRTIKQVSAAVMAGSVDTSESSVQSFLLAMALHPEVQQKARAELDKVVGLDVFVAHKDREALPYVDAIVKEVLRWQPVTPLGLPHASMADDEYRGYFIPAGTVLIPNVWAFMRDPEAYPDPHMFKPERFLKDGQFNRDVRDPFTMAFGYGRRICPGRYLAESTLWITIAMILQVYEIGLPLNEHGQPRRIEPKMTNGLISFLEDWGCTLKPRSPAAEALIRADLDAGVL